MDDDNREKMHSAARLRIPEDNFREVQEGAEEAHGSDGAHHGTRGVEEVSEQ
jgi:hypothetical protein